MGQVQVHALEATYLQVLMHKCCSNCTCCVSNHVQVGGPITGASVPTAAAVTSPPSAMDSAGSNGLSLAGAGAGSGNKSAKFVV